MDPGMATGGGGGSIPDVHSNTDSSNKTLLKSQALYKVI
jgi:caffeoyl-CoA O-methyltransferase/tricin synthase